MSRRVRRGAVTASLLAAIVLPVAGASPAAATSSAAVLERVPTGIAADTDRTAIPEDWRTAPTTAGWALPITNLGWGSTLVAVHGDSTFELTVPESGGQPLQQFEFTAELDTEALGAVISVEIDGMTVHVTKLDSATPSADVVVPVANAEAGSSLTIEVAEAEPRCTLHDGAVIARLSTPTMFFSAVRPSESEFASAVTVPDAVTLIEYRVEDTSGAAVDQAVLGLAADLARHFPGDQRQSVLNDEHSTGSGSPFALSLRVAETRETGIRSEQGRITIGGRGEELLEQSRGFVDVLTSVESVDRAVVEHSTDAPDETPMAPRFVRDITNGRLRADGSRSLSFPIVLDQADFGGPVAGYQLRVDGIATPAVLVDQREVEVGLWLDGDLLDLIELDADGRFELDTVIDGDAIARTNTVWIRMDATDQTCDGLDTYSIQLDAGSWIEAIPTDAPASSVNAFPQVFSGDLAVDVGSSIEDLSIAVDTIGLLQESTTWTLSPTTLDALAEHGEPRQVATADLVIRPDVEVFDQIEALLDPLGGRIESGDSVVSTTADQTVVALQLATGADGDPLLLVHERLPAGLESADLEQLDRPAYRIDGGALRAIGGLSTVSGEGDMVLGPEALEVIEAPTSGDHVPARQLFALGLFGAVGSGVIVLFGRRIRLNR